MLSVEKVKTWVGNYNDKNYQNTLFNIKKKIF